MAASARLNEPGAARVHERGAARVHERGAARVHERGAARLWLVDAMNVIGARPDGWWRDRPGAMRAFVALLDGWARAARAHVVVVLEGPRVAVEPAASTTLEVVWARRGGQDAADDELVARVEAERERDSVRVVTSDRRLAARVLALGAHVVAARAFRDTLEDGTRSAASLGRDGSWSGAGQESAASARCHTRRLDS